MSLIIVQDEPDKYHFNTKDTQRVQIEHKDDDYLYLTLYKWGEETSLEICLDTVPTPNHVFSGNMIEVEDLDNILRVYPIDTRTTGDLYDDSEDDVQCHDGGARFELVLKNTPVGNSFTFPLAANNLRCAYQPFLTQEDIDAGRGCPINVEGSYSFYHISKKNNRYLTGKHSHLFRPIAEDALGVKAWCSLDIDAAMTRIIITVPQQFLDDATYPITVDPDFGYQVVGANWEPIVAADQTSERAGSAWTMPAGGGTANYIRARIGSSAADTVDCKVFINQKDSGGAGTHGQIATDENLACAAAEHWEEFTLASEVLAGGVVYILDITGNNTDVIKGNTYNVRYDADGATAVASYYEGQNYAAPESPWVVNAEGVTFDYSIYCNYDVPSVGPSGGEMQMRLGLGGADVGTYKGYDLKRRR